MFASLKFKRFIALGLVATMLTFAARSPAVACPFCGAVSATFSEEIELADMAVYAELVKPHDKAVNPAQASGVDDIPRATFLVLKVLKGEKFVLKGQEFKAIYFGEAKPGSKFLIYGASSPAPEWSTPIEMPAALEKYLDAVTKFPKDRGERALKIQPYLQSDDKVVRQDAYNEFATTDYADLRKVSDRLDAKQIRSSVKNIESEDSELALAYTLLGIIGGKDDVPLLEERLRSPDDLQRKRLDALIGCYLTLKGAEGLPLIQAEFVEKDLANQNFSRLYRVLLALRFHGDDGRSVTKDKIIPILQKFLDHPKYADLVIPDLARWEDWSVKDRVMELYRDKAGEASFVREPAAKYMRVCPDPAAPGLLEEMKKIDGDAYKRAMLFPITPDKKKTETTESAQK